MSVSRFNPELSAELHNKILEHGWIGAGRELDTLPSTTWWENFSPISFDVATRLNPTLIRFLRSAKVGIYEDQKFHFFFHVWGLFSKDDLFFLHEGYMRESPRDRYISLYRSSISKSDQEVGIVFDQKNELASFIPDWDDLRLCTEGDWPWMPLQDILLAYLDMIHEQKVTTYSKPGSEARIPLLFPWDIHLHSSVDVERAISAFTRLLDAIESRLPQKLQHSQTPARGEISIEDTEVQPNQEIQFPYTSSVLDRSFVGQDSFTRAFLSSLPARHVKFRYIAPGIQLQSATEFMNQPYADLWDAYDRVPYRGEPENPHSIPLLLFRGEGMNKSFWVRPWFPGGIAEAIPSGLYIESLEYWEAHESDNETRLLMPFNIGKNGHARSGEGCLLKKWKWEGESDGLYRVSFASGVMPLDSFSSHIHRVLENWAERVESGDWEVGDNGVTGGIEKFKDADTLEHWKKYYIPWKRPN